MTIKTIKDKIYNDFISSFAGVITPLSKSFFDNFANSLSGMFKLLYIYMDNVSKESFVTTCSDNTLLTYFAPLFGVERKTATKSKGTITFFGVTGSIIPAGTILKYSKLEFITTAEATITETNIDVICESVETGEENNTTENITLKLSESLEGIDDEAISTAGFSTATNIESIEALRYRVKLAMSSSVKIENDNFYKSEAMRVENVKSVYISNAKNGAGTLGLTILTETGMTTQTDIDNVEAHFKDNNLINPAIQVEFFIPTIVHLDLSIQLSQNTESNQNEMVELIKDYLTIYQKPNTTFYIRDISDFVASKGGRVIQPLQTADINLADDEVIKLGNILWI